MKLQKILALLAMGAVLLLLAVACDGAAPQTVTVVETVEVEKEVVKPEAAAAQRRRPAHRPH